MELLKIKSSNVADAASTSGRCGVYLRQMRRLPQADVVPWPDLVGVRTPWRNFAPPPLVKLFPLCKILHPHEKV